MLTLLKRSVFLLRLLGTFLFMFLFVLLFFWGFFLPYPKRVKLIKPWSVLWAKIIVRFILKLNYRIDYNSIEPKPEKGYVSISNHLSYLDIPLLTALLSKMFLMKSSLFYSPIGWGAYLSGALGVDRQDLKKQLRAMKKLAWAVKEVEAIHLFPEGTRSETGEIAPFKRGSMHKIYQDKIRVLAVGLWGSQFVLPKSHFRLDAKALIAIKIEAWIDPKDYGDFDNFFQAVEAAVKRAVIACKQNYPA